jgi:XTP/dITP diphosphohydrolase
VQSHATALLLATRSPDKAREIRQLLLPVVPIPILTLDDAGIAEDDAEQTIEVHDTFLANAHAKAASFARVSRSHVLADDSGICVDALGGAPGVRSRRFARQPGLDGRQLDRANNERLLHELHAVPDELRTAHYTCAAVLHLLDGRRFAAIGTCAGLILREPRGDAGFGYDPLFLVPELGLTFGEAPAEQKLLRSHRARAFRALAGAIPAAALAAPRGGVPG